MIEVGRIEESNLWNAGIEAEFEHIAGRVGPVAAGGMPQARVPDDHRPRFAIRILASQDMLVVGCLAGPNVAKMGPRDEAGPSDFRWRILGKKRDLNIEIVFP